MSAFLLSKILPAAYSDSQFINQFESSSKNTLEMHERAPRLMTNSDLILLARTVANESDAKGFTHTAEAMKQIIELMLTGNGDEFAARYVPSKSENIKTRL